MVRIGELANGQSVKLDIERLIETRLLIQANSGGGKSYLIRKLLEVTHGKVQQIVLDMEGEFSTLREKYDYILAGKGGDIEANPKTAELLAKKILELNTSLIVDLYELKVHERHLFVKRFLDAMVNSPKDLWHPVLVVIDEAHVFSPEKGSSEAMNSVIDIATRGRKRGFAVCLATQRLSKLHKDVAAECLNKLIGRTSLDIDMKRASDELGFLTKQDMLALRDLDPGEFYSFGPALTKSVLKIKVDDVETNHPKAGRRGKFRVPLPTKKVKHILEKLVDLPKEAQEELNTLTDLKKRNQELQIELREARRTVVTEHKHSHHEVVSKKDLSKIKKECQKQVTQDFYKAANKFLKEYCRNDIEVSLNTDKILSEVKFNPVVKARIMEYKSKPEHVVYRRPENQKSEFGRCERAILKFLAMRPNEGFTKSQIGAMTEYAPTSGSFNNALSKLSSAGLIFKNGDAGIGLNMNMIANVISFLGDEYHEPTKSGLEGWLNKLGKCEKSIYELLLRNPETKHTKEYVADMTGYAASSGSFNNAISRLCTLGLAMRINGGGIALNEELKGL